MFIFVFHRRIHLNSLQGEVSLLQCYLLSFWNENPVDNSDQSILSHGLCSCDLPKANAGPALREGWTLAQQDVFKSFRCEQRRFRVGQWLFLGADNHGLVPPLVTYPGYTGSVLLVRASALPWHVIDDER